MYIIHCTVPFLQYIHVQILKITNSTITKTLNTGATTSLVSERENKGKKCGHGEQQAIYHNC